MTTLEEKIIANSFYELYMKPSNVFYLFDKKQAEEIIRTGKELLNRLRKIKIDV
jgi:hypothetical protein